MTNILIASTEQRHPSNFMCGIEGHDWWLIVFAESRILFHTPDGDVLAMPGSVAVFPPNKWMFYEAAGEEFVNSYFRFTTDEDFIINSTLPKSTPIALENPVVVKSIITSICFKYYHCGNDDQVMLRYLLRSLFYEITASSQDKVFSLQRQQLLKLRHEIMSSPHKDWTLDKMAELVHVSPGYLSNIYKKEFGISCFDDVINQRINLAKDLVLNTNHKIEVIAYMCGYSCSEHFSRQFKRKVGMSPAKYRKIMHMKAPH